MKKKTHAPTKGKSASQAERAAAFDAALADPKTSFAMATKLMAVRQARDPRAAIALAVAVSARMQALRPMPIWVRVGTLRRELAELCGPRADAVEAATIQAAIEACDQPRRGRPRAKAKGYVDALHALYVELKLRPARGPDTTRKLLDRAGVLRMVRDAIT